MNKKLKVLLIEHSLPLYHLPAWELLASHRDIELTIAYGKGFFTGKDSGVPEATIPKNANAIYYHSYVLRKFMFVKYLWHSIGLELVRNNQYDVIIHQFEIKILSLFLTLKACKRKNSSFLLWGIGSSLKGDNKIIDGIRKYFARTCEAIIFYSSLNKQKYLKMGIPENKMYVAQNSIDIDDIINYSKQYKRKNINDFRSRNNLNSFTVMTIGRLQERKKIEWLIDAIKTTKEMGYNFKLVIIGNGEKLTALKEKTILLDLSSQVIFTGRLQGIDSIGPWFMSSDIVVAPGQIGHLATEAHAYGKPLIITNNPLRHRPEAEILIEDKTGVTYQDGDVLDLSKKIIKFYKEKDLDKKYKNLCQKRAKDFTGCKKMVNGFIKAINNIKSSNLDFFN